MVNEMITHHNDLNTVIMRTWTSEEMNFFFAILAKVKNKGTKELFFETNELKSLVKSPNRSKKRWEKTMVSCAKKVTQLTYFESRGRTFEVMTIFNKFKIEMDKQKVFIKLSDNFDYIFNRLSANFTTYELEEFTKIRSTYAKTIYRILKQWRTVGKKEFKIDEFRLLLDMPSYYTPSEIDRIVLKPTVKELSVYFGKLRIKKIKSNKKGNPVLGYEFTWKPEKINEVRDVKLKSKYSKKTKISNKPKWHNMDYINKTTPEQKQKLDKLKREALDKLNSIEYR